MTMFNNGYEFTINYEKLTESFSLFEVTKSLAKKLMSTPYMTVADFLVSLKDEDLTLLLEASVVDEDDSEEDTYNENAVGLQDLILISEMLATAEGLDSSDSLEISNKRLSHLVSFLAIESLGRKGLVKVYQKNMSFDEDMSRKIIAERIENDSDDYQE